MFSWNQNGLSYTYRTIYFVWSYVLVWIYYAFVLCLSRWEASSVSALNRGNPISACGNSAIAPHICGSLSMPFVSYCRKVLEQHVYILVLPPVDYLGPLYFFFRCLGASYFFFRTLGPVLIYLVLTLVPRPTLRGGFNFTMHVWYLFTCCCYLITYMCGTSHRLSLRIIFFSATGV